MDGKQLVCGYKSYLDILSFTGFTIIARTENMGAYSECISGWQEDVEKETSKTTHTCIPPDRWIKRIVSYYFNSPKGK